MDYKVSFVVLSIMGFYIGGLCSLYLYGTISVVRDSLIDPDWKDIVYWFGFFCKYVYEPMVYFTMIIFIILPKVK